MLFASDSVREDLSKSSTILQCALALLDFEANKFHAQPKCFDVENNIATVDMDGLDFIQIMMICMAVNKQFKRIDGANTCYHLDVGDKIVICEVKSLSEYMGLI